MLSVAIAGVKILGVGTVGSLQDRVGYEV